MICFEELTQNPGSPEQYAQFAMIRTALNLELSLDEMLEVYFSVFGQGPTYSGKIGNWREVFTNEHKQACKAHIGDLLIELGYETGYDW